MELQGWYRQDNDSEERVRLVVEGRSLKLQTLSDRLLAQWSLDHLENVSAPILDSKWIIGDRRLPGPILILENDDDYRAVQGVAFDLAPTHRRTWKQLGYAFIESSNQTGLLVFVLLLVIAGATAVWSAL